MKTTQLIKIMAENGLKYFEGIRYEDGFIICFSEIYAGRGNFCRVDYDNNKKEYRVQCKVFGPLTRLFVDYKHMCKVLKENVKEN